jgi:DNA-binding beta-propeller fold protein YncE
MRGRGVLIALVVLALRPAPACSEDERLFVTVEGAGAVVVTGGGSQNRIAVGGRPHNLAASPGGRRLWVTDSSSPRVRVVDVASESVTPLPVR